MEILTTVLNTYMDVLLVGIARLMPAANNILFYLLVIQLAVMGVWITMGGYEQLAASLIEVGFKTAIFTWLIANWAWLTKTLIKGMVAYGLLGGGSTMSENDFTDPSMLATYGYSAMVPAMNKLLAYRGWDVLFNFPDIFFSGLAAIGAIVAYVWFGLQTLVAQLQFYFHATSTTVLIPWGMRKETSFLAEKAFAIMWAHAIKMLVLSLIASVGVTIMQLPSVRPGLNPDFWRCVDFAVLGWTLVVLAVVGPKTAYALLQSSPNLSTQDLAHVSRSTVQSIARLGAFIQSMTPARSAQSPNPGASPRRPVT